MSRKGARCYGCRDAGKRPKYVEKVPSVVYYPPIMMPGQPTLEGHRLSAQSMAEYVWSQGFKATLEDYDLSRAELLVACWWAGLHGPRKWKQRWREWATVAEGHLWYSCINVPDPPVEAVESGA